ncbi:hypothetical protein TNIN_268721, partial [Trichonephila inaurata madagascariensis]
MREREKEDISENKLEKDEKCVVETEKSQKELDCKKCGETFKDLEGLIAHNCPHKETKETKLDLPTIINFLVEKQLSVHKSKDSPDESIIGDSSKNRTSSVVSQRSLSSRRSLPAPMTFCPEKERTKTFSDKYPAHATSSQSFPYSLTLKDYLLSQRDSAAKNLFQPRKRSHSDSGYRSPQSECIKKDSTRSMTHVTSKKDSPESLSLTTCKQSSLPSTETRIGYSSKSLTGSVTTHKFPSRKSVPPTKTKHTKIEVSKLVLPKYPTYVTPPRSIPSSQAPKDNFLNVKDSAIRNLLQPYKIPCSATGYRSPQSECIEKDSARSETLVTSKKDSPESLSLTTCKQLSSSSTETSIGDSSKGLTGSVTTHKFPSRKSFPPTKTRHTKMEASKPVSQKYPTYVTPPRSIPSSQALKDDFINVKDSATQSPWYYKGEIIAYSSASVRNATPQIFEIFDGTIETSSPEIESENFDSSESSTFSSPKPVSPCKNERDSAAKNLFQPRERSHSDSGYRSPQSECIKKDSTRSLTHVTSKIDSPESLSLTTCKQSSLPSTETRIGYSSKSLTGSVTSHKFPSRKSVPSTKTKHTKIEVSKLVLQKYPTYVTPPRSIPSSQAPKDNFLNVKDSAIRNLFQPYKIPCSATGYRSPQSECIEKDSTRTETLVTSKKDSPESLSITTCKQFSSSSTETSIGDSSKGLTGSVTTHKFPSRKSFPPTKTRHTKMEASKLVLQKYPTYVTPPRSIPSSQALKDDFLNVKDSATQSPWYYKGEIIAYSSGSVSNATPQIFEIYDGTIKTSSPEIESENFDSSEFLTFSLPKPVSPFKKSSEDSSGSVVDTISD